AADPIYCLSPEKIAADFEPNAERMLEGMGKAYHRFKWDHYGTPQKVIERRRIALNKFLTDFKRTARGGRYVAARLPQLPFNNRSFDLVLCGHLLFLYSADLSVETHVASLREMLRVGNEVRIFPLLDMDGNLSSHLEPAMNELKQIAQVDLVPVPFEF